jgi:hypothetical protein
MMERHARKAEHESGAGHTADGRWPADGVPVSSEITLSDCLEAVEVCCEHARAAVSRHRFQAALGLMITAHQLCRHALEQVPPQADGMRAVIEEKLSAVEKEKTAYAELVKSMSRPLTSQRNLQSRQPGAERGMFKIRRNTRW